MQKSKTPTLLYAPTWQDGGGKSSFPRICPLLKTAPKEFTLLLKLHPHLYLQFPEEIAEMKAQIPEHVHVIEDFPPIYPLLARVNLYIGDLSSIGYDFLSFKRPMLFLEPSELTQVGDYLPAGEEEFLFERCAKLLESPFEDKGLYAKTFSKCDEEAINSLRSIGQ